MNHPFFLLIKMPGSLKDPYPIFTISSENGLKIQVIKSNGFGIWTPRASAILNAVPNRSRDEKIASSFFLFFLTRGGTSIAIITADMIRMPTTAITTTPFSIDKKYDLQLSHKLNINLDVSVTHFLLFGALEPGHSRVYCFFD